MLGLDDKSKSMKYDEGIVVEYNSQLGFHSIECGLQTLRVRNLLTKVNKNEIQVFERVKTQSKFIRIDWHLAALAQYKLLRQFVDDRPKDSKWSQVPKHSCINLIANTQA